MKIRGLLLLALSLLLTLLGGRPVLADTYTYDPLNRLTRLAYSDGGSIDYTYDAAGNIKQIVKTAKGTTPDIEAPVISGFSLLTTSTSLTIPLAFSASDNFGVSSYCAAESSNSSACTIWSSTAPTSFTFTSFGAKSLYVFARDAADNISAAAGGMLTLTSPDTAAPTITAFALPTASTSSTVTITNFIATDNVGVAGYCTTESNDPTGCTWGTLIPTGYTFAGIPPGIATSKTLYVFTKDAANNISSSASSSVVITLPPTASFAVQLPQTGQTVCYDSAGATITCTGTGQDGDAQMGTAWPSPHFTDNSSVNSADLTVTDNLTGLIWTKNANLVGIKTWQDSLTYIKDLNASNYLNHNDWRLPNRNELESLINRQQANSASWLNSQAFTNVQADYYWTSSSYATDNNHALIVHFNAGYVANRLKTSNFFAWPVRGGQGGAVSLPQTGQTVCYDASSISRTCSGTGEDGELQNGTAWPSQRFRDNSISTVTDLTVTDTLTGLTWAKNGNLTSGTKIWQDALTYINTLNSTLYLGHNDWRLPNINELSSLINKQQPVPADWLNTQGFANVQADNYWSSSSYVGSGRLAWFVYMAFGLMDYSNKTNSYYLLPVRGGQPGIQLLTLTKSGTGMGSVSSNNGTLNWSGNNGTASYNSGSSVTLTATADTGSLFTNWSGCDSTTTTTCTVTMNAAKNVSASFTAQNQPVQISSTSLSNSSGGIITAMFQGIDPEGQTMGYEVWLSSGTTPVSGTKKVNPWPVQSGSSSSLSYTPSELAGLLSAGASYRARIWVFDSAGLISEVYTSNLTYLAPQTITFNPPSTATYGDTAITLNASANSGLPVSFTLVSGPATLNGTTLSITGAGSIVVKATQSGNSDYLAAVEVQKIIVVNKASASVALDGLSQTYNGSQRSVTATTNPPGLYYTVTYNGSSTVPTNTGTYAVVATISDSNFSGTASGTLVITNAPDTTVPLVADFTIQSTSTSLIVPVDTLSATDNIGVASYLLSETSSEPQSDDLAWSATQPTQYVFTSQGVKTLYAFAKDVAGNISVPLSDSATITLADTSAPTVSAFTVPATATSLTVLVSALSASDNVAVTEYLLSETANQPLSSDPAWSAIVPTSYLFASQGAKTLYAFSKDAAGNISVPLSSGVTIHLSDTTAPTVTTFTLPPSATSLTVPVSVLTASDTVAVTGYLLLETASQPQANDPIWALTIPSSYTFATQGAKTLYAFAKDAAGNISAPLSATITITLPDTAAPTITSFLIPTTSTSLTVPVTSLTAIDSVNVTGYLLNETATIPSVTDLHWTATPTSSYTFANAGAKALYAWAKDAAGNLSNAVFATVTITLPDMTAPSVSQLIIPPSITSLTIAVTALSATDDIAVTGYLLSESATPPLPDNPAWTSTPPTSYTFAAQGERTIYAFAKDAAGNVSTPFSATVIITMSDTNAPTVTAFALTSTSTSLTVPVLVFTATDNVAITGYFLSESALTPLPTGSFWSSTPLGSYTFSTGGSKTLYAFTKDASGNISNFASASTTVTLPTVSYGDLDNDGTATSADALFALQMAIGKKAIDLKADLAPLINGVPAPDGKVTAADALVILRKAVGLW